MRRSAGVRAPGSSPLARGLLTSDYGMRVNPGIIPARAGFTRTHLLERILKWDHPRSRGVYAVSNSIGSMFDGSSPLPRGLRRLAHDRAPREGIIPARAGFTPGAT